MHFPQQPTYGEIALIVIALCQLIMATPTASILLHAFFCPCAQDDDREHALHDDDESDG